MTTILILAFAILAVWFAFGICLVIFDLIFRSVTLERIASLWVFIVGAAVTGITAFKMARVAIIG
jgi:hypothetical protein